MVKLRLRNHLFLDQFFLKFLDSDLFRGVNYSFVDDKRIQKWVKLVCEKAPFTVA